MLPQALSNCLINAFTMRVDFKLFDFSGYATYQELGTTDPAPR